MNFKKLKAKVWNSRVWKLVYKINPHFDAIIVILYLVVILSIRLPQIDPNSDVFEDVKQVFLIRNLFGFLTAFAILLLTRNNGKSNKRFGLIGMMTASLIFIISVSDFLTFSRFTDLLNFFVVNHENHFLQLLQAINVVFWLYMLSGIKHHLLKKR